MGRTDKSRRRRRSSVPLADRAQSSWHAAKQLFRSRMRALGWIIAISFVLLLAYGIVTSLTA